MKTIKEALFSRKNIKRNENVIFELQDEDNHFRVGEEQRYIAFELYNKKRSYTVLLEKEDVKNLIEEIESDDEDSDYHISEDNYNVMLVFTSDIRNKSYIEFQDDETKEYDQIVIPDYKLIELSDNLESYINTHNIK